MGSVGRGLVRLISTGKLPIQTTIQRVFRKFFSVFLMSLEVDILKRNVYVKILIFTGRSGNEEFQTARKIFGNPGESGIF